MRQNCFGSWALEVGFSPLKEGYQLCAPYCILKSKPLNNLKLKCNNFKIEFFKFAHIDEGNTSNCSVSLEEKLLVQILVCSNLSAAVEGHDKDLQRRFFPQDQP